MYDKFPLQVNIVLIVGLNFFDLSDITYTLVIYITYYMGNRDLPDIYAHALGPAALGIYLYMFMYIYYIKTKSRLSVRPSVGTFLARTLLRCFNSDRLQICSKWSARLRRSRLAFFQGSNRCRSPSTSLWMLRCRRFLAES